MSSRVFGPRRGAVTVAALALTVGLVFASTAGALAERVIVPGKSIGFAAIGMTRKTVEQKLRSPIPPKRANDGRFYSLTYRYPYRANNPGRLLIITFNGLGRTAKAFSLVTTDPSLSTRPGGIGVLDTHLQLLATFSGVDCYHSDLDGTRHENYQENENSECELHQGGGYTYFSFASEDADPRQRVGAVAVSAIRAD